MTAQVQNAGLARITAALEGLTWYLQWGTGSGAAPSANTVTTAGTNESRPLAAASQATVSVTDDTLELTATISANGTRAITEVGAFDAAGTGSPPVGGNMDIYGDFSVLNLTVGDAVSFTMRTTFS